MGKKWIVRFGWLVFSAIMIAFYFYWGNMVAFEKLNGGAGELKELEKWALYGDAFGPLTSLFTCAALIVAAWSFYLQKEEFIEAKKAILDQAEELKKANEHQHRTNQLTEKLIALEEDKLAWSLAAEDYRMKRELWGDPNLIPKELPHFSKTGNARAIYEKLFTGLFNKYGNNSGLDKPK